MAAAAILKIAFFGHNSSTDCPISAIFFMRKQNSMTTRATWQKLQLFKIQDGGLPPFWKWLNRHISVKNRPILMKLGSLHQILNPMTVTWPKIEIFKIQDCGGGHLENRFFFGHYSLTDRSISAKFCKRKQNGMLIRATGQKMQIFKVQDVGRPPFWKLLNRHISVKNYPISMIFSILQQMLNPIAVTWPKINSFKIQDGGDRHLENCDITISQWNYYWILTKFGVLQNILNLMMFSKALSQYLRCDKDVIR